MTGRAGWGGGRWGRHWEQAARRSCLACSLVYCAVCGLLGRGLCAAWPGLPLHGECRDQRREGQPIVRGHRRASSVCAVRPREFLALRTEHGVVAFAWTLVWPGRLCTQYLLIPLVHLLPCSCPRAASLHLADCTTTAHTSTTIQHRLPSTHTAHNLPSTPTAHTLPSTAHSTEPAVRSLRRAIRPRGRCTRLRCTHPGPLLPAPVAPVLSAIMADIQTSFAFLHDNIPRWLQDVAAIETNMVALQSQLSRVPVSRAYPFKKRSGSVESIREEPPASAAGQKRKEPSLLSAHPSGPSKLRSRTMVVVHYDGHIQASLELLVRAIGTGRNMLRKAKMAAKMEAMAAMAASSSDDDDDDDNDNDNDESNAIMAKIGYRHRGLSSMRTRGMMRMTERTSSTSLERFDTADKALEEAQALCERAAHQSLREGDCRKELNGVRGFFNEVAELAKTEVARHAAQKLIADEKEQQPVLHQLPLPGKQSSTPLPDVEKDLIPTRMPPTITTNNTSKVIDIEIDDEEDSDHASFVLPPLRLSSRV